MHARSALVHLWFCAQFLHMVCSYRNRHRRAGKLFAQRDRLRAWLGGFYRKQLGLERKIDRMLNLRL
jgi:hypothetical protein